MPLTSAQLNCFVADPDDLRVIIWHGPERRAIVRDIWLYPVGGASVAYLGIDDGPGTDVVTLRGCYLDADVGVYLNDLFLVVEPEQRLVLYPVTRAVHVTVSGNTFPDAGPSS